MNAGESVMTDNKIGANDKERQAVAMLKAGMSFADAAKFTGLPVERVIDLWNFSQSLPKPAR